MKETWHSIRMGSAWEWLLQGWKEWHCIPSCLCLQPRPRSSFHRKTKCPLRDLKEIHWDLQYNLEWRSCGEGRLYWRFSRSHKEPKGTFGSLCDLLNLQYNRDLRRGSLFIFWNNFLWIVVVLMETNTNVEQNLAFYRNLTQNFHVEVRYISESKGYGLFSTKNFDRGKHLKY
jgi:hypothetical protein